MYSNRTRSHKTWTKGYLSSNGRMGENGIVKAIDKTRRNRSAFLEKMFGGPEQGYFDGVYAPRYKR